MRLLIIDAVYPRFVHSVYGAGGAPPEGEDYAGAFSRLAGSALPNAANWLQYELSKTPGVEPVSVIANCAPLQRLWARENGVPRPGDDWLHTTVAAQIAHYRPDAILVFPISVFRRGFFDETCQGLPVRPLLAAWDGVAANDPAIAREFDAVVSCIWHTTAFYRGCGTPAETLTTGFDQRISPQIAARSPRYGSVFAGSVDLSTVYRDRFELLYRLHREAGTRLHLQRLPPHRATGRFQLGLVRRGRFGDAKKLHALGSHNRGAVFGLEMFQLLADSKISVNHHGTEHIGNRRLYEATGAGSCLVTDWHDSAPDIFVPDREAVYYRSHEECVEKIKYLLDHEGERAAIAAAGAARTARDYTTAGFARSLLAFFSSLA